MSKYVYIVVESDGQYEDHIETSVSAHSTEENANTKIERLLAERQELDKKFRLLDSYIDSYKESCPSPVFNRANFLDRPRWASGLGKEQITDEMRADRAKVDAHNDALISAWHAAIVQWEQKALVAINAKRKEIGLEERENFYAAVKTSISNSKFSVETVQLED